MSKNFIFAVAALLAMNVSASADIDTSKLIEKKSSQTSYEGIELPIPAQELDTKWKYAYGALNPDGPSIFEWIPAGEDIDHWTQLIQIQFIPLPNSHLTSQEFADLFIAQLKKELPEVEAQILQKLPDGVVLEWKLAKEANGQVPQDEIAKIMISPSGIHRIAFTIKVPSMDESLRKTWIERISKAKLASQPVERKAGVQG